MNREKKTMEKKSCSKKSYNKYMEDLTTIQLIQNCKNPKNKWQDKKNQSKTNIYKFDSKKQYCNLGVPTGKVNNITVVDLDFYSKDDEVFNLEDSTFIKTFGYNYIEDFDTFTVKTPSGGIHLYFKYDEDIGQTANKEHQVDTRNNGGYVVSPNSIVKGNKYEIIKDTHFKHIPDNLKEYLVNVILNKKVKKKVKKKRKEIKKTEDKEEEIIEEEGYYHLDKFTYNFSDELLIEIIKGLPKKYFNSYEGWLIFTTAMKQINRKDLWEKFPKLNNPVDGNIKSDGHIDWMNSAWDNIKRHNQYNCFSNLLLNTKVQNARTMLEYYMYIDYDVHETKPDIIINQDKLTDENYSNFLEKSLDKKSCDCLIMKSDTGTGKTTSFTKYFLKQKKTKFLSIVSRVSLAQEQYMTFSKSGIDCGLYNIIDGRLKSNDNYVITIDSILRVANWDSWEYKNYIIYLDEFNSMIEYLICADTLNNKRVAVFHGLLRILNKCKKIICTDADINDISLSFLKLVDKSKIFIQNDFLHNKNVKSQELFSYNDFCHKLHLEKKFLCCCDSKTQAEMIHQELIQYGVRDVKLITSDTDEYINLDNHDKIIYSPKIVYGLDSTIKRPVYCYYKERTIPPTAMIQQIARCRNIRYLRYTFEMKKVKIEDEDFSLDYVKEELKQLESFGNEFCSFKLMSKDCISESYLDFYTRYSYLNRCYEINKFGHFIKLLQKRGFVNDSITYYNTSLKGTREMRGKVKELKEENFTIDHPTVMKINDYLKIDTKENIMEHKEYFLNQSKLDNHFNISKYFFNNIEDIKEELFNQEEFNVKKVTSTKSKIKFLQEIKDLTGCQDNNDIIVKNPLDLKNADFYATNYNKVWNASIKKTDIDFTKKEVLTQYMYKMYKNLFGNELVKNTKRMVNKKRITEYKFNNKVLEQEHKLYKFRERAKNKR